MEYKNVAILMTIPFTGLVEILCMFTDDNHTDWESISHGVHYIGIGDESDTPS